MWDHSLVLLALITYASTSGILYPRESESREVKSLDGMWNFKLSLPDPLVGFKERWYMKDLSKVYVPMFTVIKHLNVRFN